jgi:uncharacterized zinc-type alcohol dehydrogenase-like protein
MAVKFGASFGAEVTVLSTSPGKENEARRLGARDFVLVNDAARMSAVSKRFDFILDTVSAAHDLDGLLGLLRRDGALILVGAPPDPIPVSAFSLILGRRTLAGSLIGGIPEMREMLEVCAKTGVQSDVEVIAPSQVNAAFDRVVRGDVRYRFVLDMKKI